MSTTKTNQHQAAIEAIEAITALYNVKFTMARTPKKLWKIQTMGKRFVNHDFNIACQEAVAFVYTAHGGSY